MDWFYQQRAYPHKTIPPDARRKALERREAMRRAERARQGGVEGAAFLTAAPSVWMPIGPQPTSTDPQFQVGLVSGRVSALAADPTNANVVYLGGAQGGVWKTTNGGVSWTPMTDFQPSLAVGSIAIDPTSCSPAPCRTIYVGTGEQVFSIDAYYGAGILKSTDGGNTWAQLPGTITNVPGFPSFVGPFSPITGGSRIGSLAVNPQSGNILLAGVQMFVQTNGGSSSGIYRSLDGGVTWTQVLSGAAGTEVLYDPINPNIAYAALGSVDCGLSQASPCSGPGDSDNGVYKSTDGGATWSRVLGPSSTVLPSSSMGRVELAIAPSNPSILYAGIQNSSTANFGTLLGFFKSSNSGQSWTRLTGTPDYCADQCWYDHVIRVHPNNANVVYAGGSAVRDSMNRPIYLIRSIDGGNQWTGIAFDGMNLLHVDQHAMAFGFSGPSATKLYVGNDGGVWSADVSNPTGGIGWANRNDGLALSQFYPGHSIHPSSEKIGFGGTQDNSVQKYTGSPQWDSVACGDGGWTAIDPFVPSTVYAECQAIAILKSLQNGTRSTFTFADNGINLDDESAFIPPFIIDPNVPDRLYFGTFRVYQSMNGGDSWSAISNDLSGQGVSDITTIAVAPSDSNTVYAGTGGGRVFVNMSAGMGVGAINNWVSVSVGLPNRVVTMVAVDPTVSTLAYATFSGFGSCSSCDGQGHVFKTINGGTSWTDISKAPFSMAMTELPDTPVNDIVIDPDDPTGLTLYVATDVGVFVTTDGGLNWSTMNNGLPNVAVFSLKLRRASRTLRAATHGRSAWDFQLPDTRTYFLSSISPVTAVAGSTTDLPLVVDGGGFTASSVVQWNGVNLATTPDLVNPSTRLTATVLASMLTSPTVAQVQVNDSGQGVTASMPFTVTGGAPTLTSINPTQCGPAPCNAFSMTLSGANFASNAIVRFNGVDRTPSTLSSTQITVQIPASDVAVGGVFPVNVFNPPPGGGISPEPSQTPVTFTVTAPPPPNDNFANAIIVGVTPFTDSQNTVGATTEATDPVPPASCFPSGSPGIANSGRAKTIWYKFTPTTNVTISADTAGSAYDTILSVWTGGPPAAFSPTTCNDDVQLGVIRHSQLSFSASANTTYSFMISAYEGDGGTTVFNLMTGPPGPDFAVGASPSVITVIRGQSGTTTVSVTGFTGFASAVTLSCSGLPSLSSCAFSPASVTPGAQPATSMLTISTTAGSSVPTLPAWPWTYFLYGCALAAMLAAVLRMRSARKPAWAAGWALLILLGLAALHTGCGGGGGGSSPPPNPGTPRGTFTVTITGTSGTTTRSATLTLTVN